MSVGTQRLSKWNGLVRHPPSVIAQNHEEKTETMVNDTNLQNKLGEKCICNAFPYHIIDWFMFLY